MTFLEAIQTLALLAAYVLPWLLLTAYLEMDG